MLWHRVIQNRTLKEMKFQTLPTITEVYQTQQEQINVQILVIFGKSYQSL